MKQTKDGDGRPLGSFKSWARTPGTYIAGQAAIDGVDQTAIEMESKWGAGRLRLLVGNELREKFDRQRYLFNQAIWHGDLAAVQMQAARMATAWKVLDTAATMSGAEVLPSIVWEVALEDGTVMAIVRSQETAKTVLDTGRQVVVYTTEELAQILTHYRNITETKLTFPGVTVEKIRRQTIEDPLNALRDSDADLDDPIFDPDVGLN